MSGIDIRNISKSFGEKKVLKDVSLRIEEGVTTCLMAPSGFGKTTLLRIISGLETADAGTIEGSIGKISFVFQEDRLSEDFSAVSNIRFVVGRSVPAETVTGMLKEFGLGDSMNKPVRVLSGGMKRRVAIARALCTPYDLLIMDEPLKGLDEKLKQSVMQTIKQKTEGKTVIYVTHDRTEAEFFAGNVIDMSDSK